MLNHHSMDPLRVGMDSCRGIVPMEPPMSNGSMGSWNGYKLKHMMMGYGLAGEGLLAQ